MTKQLTNKQLNIITDVIYEKVIDGYEKKKQFASQSHHYTQYKKQLNELEILHKRIDDYQEAYRKANETLSEYRANFNNQFQNHDLQLTYHSSNFKPTINISHYSLKRKINQHLILFHSTNDMEKLIDLIVKKLID